MKPSFLDSSLTSLNEADGSLILPWNSGNYCDLYHCQCLPILKLFHNSHQFGSISYLSEKTAFYTCRKKESSALRATGIMLVVPSLATSNIDNMTVIVYDLIFSDSAHFLDLV